MRRSSFSSHDDEGEITGINVTPLVDITLVLLIIFMVTTTYIIHPSIRVDLPKASAADKGEASMLSLVLDAEGVLFLNGKSTTEAAVIAYIQDEVAKDPDLKAVISADTVLQYGAVVHLLDLIKQHGVTKYALNIKYTGDDSSP